MMGAAGRQLYSADELFSGFNPWDPMGFTLTRDFSKKTKLPNIKAAREWLKIAIEARMNAPNILPISLAVPTWLYGAEPTNPFATHYAKYYQNSLREEALINNSRAGIIYCQGGGGTVREIFQAVERNFYVPSLDELTPMIFFDRDNYWSTDAIIGEHGATTRGIKLDSVVTKVLTYGLVSSKNDKSTVERCLREKLKFSIDHDEIVAALRTHTEISQRNLKLAVEGMFLAAQSTRSSAGSQWEVTLPRLFGFPVLHRLVGFPRIDRRLYRRAELLQAGRF
jgi:hypothetical protein